MIQGFRNYFRDMFFEQENELTRETWTFTKINIKHDRACRFYRGLFDTSEREFHDFYTRHRHTLFQMINHSEIVFGIQMYKVMKNMFEDGNDEIMSKLFFDNDAIRLLWLGHLRLPIDDQTIKIINKQPFIYSQIQLNSLKSVELNAQELIDKFYGDVE